MDQKLWKFRRFTEVSGAESATVRSEICINSFWHRILTTNQYNFQSVRLRLIHGAFVCSELQSYFDRIYEAVVGIVRRSLS